MKKLLQKLGWWKKDPTPPPETQVQPVLSEEEERQIKERLQSLGYLG